MFSLQCSFSIVKGVQFRSVTSALCVSQWRCVGCSAHCLIYCPWCSILSMLFFQSSLCSHFTAPFCSPLELLLSLKRECEFIARLKVLWNQWKVINTYFWYLILGNRCRFFLFIVYLIRRGIPSFFIINRYNSSNDYIERKKTIFYHICKSSNTNHIRYLHFTMNFVIKIDLL